MKFNERLIAARKFAGLTQQQLIEKLPPKEDGKPMMSQANLAKMEKNPNTVGSNNSYFIAKACNVSVEWLLSGVGEMEAISYDLTKELCAHLQVMQQLPDYARTEVIRDAIKTAELITKAQAATKGNGTE